MTQENLAYLHNDLKYLGFGEHSVLNHLLETEVNRGTPVFELYTEAFFDEETRLEATLHFKRSEKTEQYHFTKYDAVLRYPENPERDKAQTFSIFKGAGVTLKEAFNLLQGRAVFKRTIDDLGEKKVGWMQLDFDRKTRYGNFTYKHFWSQQRFDLARALAHYKIREMETEETREMLFRSLRKGNIHPVTMTMQKSNKAEKMFIHANPLQQTINIIPAATRAARNDKGKREIDETPDTGESERPVRESLFEEDADPAHAQHASL